MDGKIISHLSEDYTIPVRDPLWKHIYLSPGLRKIMYHPEFQKLGRIRQLGPAVLVYPGAAHTRLNHSLGVFYLARRILKSILFSGNCPDYLSLKGVKSFLAASLLHDIGHFPHAHSFMELPLKDHEVLSGEIIMNSGIGQIIKEDVGGDPFLTAKIIDTSLPDEDNRELIFFRNILSGVLDPDKLDYLNRDAYFCGVPYGMQDIDFVISQIRPVSGGIGMTAKGLTAVENILFSKYLMYKTVYWHRDVRIATALVKKAVYLGLAGGFLKPEELYGMDDDTFFKRMTEAPGELAALVRDSERPRNQGIICQLPFNEEDNLHNSLVNLDFRYKHEQCLERMIEARYPGLIPRDHLVIDIPSKISFEVDLPIVDKQGLVSYKEAPSVFSTPVVRGFTRTLRHIRIIVPASAALKIPTLELDPFSIP